jgi:nitric oxide reductase subunit B
MITSSVFAVGVGLFIYDFFRHAPRIEIESQPETVTAP